MVQLLTSPPAAMADAAAVDAALQRILAVTLDKVSAAAGQDPPVLFLEGLAEVRFECPIGRPNTWQPHAKLLACMHKLMKHECNVVKLLGPFQGQLHDGTCSKGLEQACSCSCLAMPVCWFSGAKPSCPPDRAPLAVQPCNNRPDIDSPASWNQTICTTGNVQALQET